MTNRPVTESLDVGAREAVNDFFDALSKWRDEVASSTERYSETLWEKMVKSPMPAQFVAQLQSYPGVGLGPSSGNAPVQLWMEAAQFWQRNWASAFSMWTGTGNRTQQSPRTAPPR